MGHVAWVVKRKAYGVIVWKREGKGPLGRSGLLYIYIYIYIYM
jgi:hypothetical protein